MMKLDYHGWETSCRLGKGFCSRSQKLGYISFSLAPNRTNSIAIQVLNKQVLGVLSIYGDGPAAQGTSFFCAPY